MESQFELGGMVYLRADKARIGSIVALLPPTGGQARYRVFHAPGDIREYHEEQLIALDVPPPTDDFAEALLRGDFIDAAVFRARLTAARLAHPLTDTLYALQAARIKSIPFQFKPLLRLLRADRPRMLIADEVGVGKTIEAGMILKELQTRQQVENVLIVCPKALVTKWRTEMLRFDEDFRPLTAETLRYCLRETELDGVWPQEYSRAIVHLELFRNDEYLNGTFGRQPRAGLAVLDPPPHFSLLILDEAHHVRNPGTNSYELARLLCDRSEAAIFLSATPVHLGAQNLHTLLHLLRPDLFPDESVFEEMIAPNQYLTYATRAVRTRSPIDAWQELAHTALASAAATLWGERLLRTTPEYEHWIYRLALTEPLTDAERISCLRDLEELHTLAHVMNRTRRRDIGRFTIREPHTIAVPFTDAQQELYDLLIQFRRDVLALDYDPRVIRLITDTLERQAASCLPALVPAFNRFISTGRFSVQELTDNEFIEDDVSLPTDLLQRADSLRRMAHALPSEDPKLEQLQLIVRETVAGEGPKKLLVFSFFLHTLGYLATHLQSSGFRVGVVTGKIADEEREHLRQQFRYPFDHPNALDVLLSSEVGCEGLDYEFCDRLVNYDIPWNPMRIEQRIGRIDRFGQRSDKVLIFNFITPNTVEERVFFRCFERLGIFRDTIGDHEAVLGDIVQDLTRIALDPQLSLEQAEEQALQRADNTLRYIEEQRRLETESGIMLGLDTAYTEDVDRIIAEGRFVASEDLRHMVLTYLQASSNGALRSLHDQPGVDKLRLSREARRQMLDHIRQLEQQNRATRTFMRWLEGNTSSLTVTFDQQVALDERELPFITPLHPLSQLAMQQLLNNSRPLVGKLLIADSSMPSGTYTFMCELWETIAVKPDIKFVTVAIDNTTGCVEEKISAALVRLLGGAQTIDGFVQAAEDVSNQHLEQLNELVFAQYRHAVTTLAQTNQRLLDRKLTSVDTYFANRLHRVQTEHAAATNPQIQRMKQSEIARIDREHQQQRATILARQESDIVRQRIALGVLTITD